MKLVVRLMERLLDYRTIMHDENKENRMSCTVNVLVSKENYHPEMTATFLILHLQQKICVKQSTCWDSHESLKYFWVFFLF